MTESIPKHSVTLTCSKCTRFETVKGEDERDCNTKAQAKGWYAGWRGEELRFVCPKCPARRS